MAKNFDEILTSMLEQLENNPDQDIDVLVKDECEKMGVSEEGKALFPRLTSILMALQRKWLHCKRLRRMESLVSNGCLRRWTEY